MTVWEEKKALKKYSRYEHEHTHAICLLFHILLIVVLTGRRQTV